MQPILAGLRNDQIRFPQQRIVLVLRKLQCLAVGTLCDLGLERRGCDFFIQVEH